MWYGMLWYGIVWCGVGWDGMVWCGVSPCMSVYIIGKFYFTTIISLNSFCDFSLFLRCSTKLSKADVQL